MRKILLFLLCVLLLTGCQASSVDEVLKGVDSIPLLRANNLSYYFDYYLPSDVSEKEFSNTSAVFAYSDALIVMNLNLAQLLSDGEALDDGFFSREKLTYEYEGTYQGSDGAVKKYHLELFEIEDRSFIHLLTEDMSIYGQCLKGNTVDVVDRVLLIAKNVRLYKDRILSDFSYGNMIDYERKQIDLFEKIIAPNGRLEDMVIN